MVSPSQALAGDLMSHCESCMQSAANTHEADTIRQSIVVLMGTLAKHMDKENPKVRETLTSHADSLSPSTHEEESGYEAEGFTASIFTAVMYSVFAGEVCGALVAV